MPEAEQSPAQLSGDGPTAAPALGAMGSRASLPEVPRSGPAGHRAGQLTVASCLALISSNTLIKPCEGRDGRIQPNEVCWEDIPGAWQRDPWCSNASSPCVLLLPSAPEPKPPRCAHGLPRISAVARPPRWHLSRAAGQQLQPHTAQAGPCRRPLPQEPAQLDRLTQLWVQRGTAASACASAPPGAGQGCKGLGQPKSGSRPHPEPGGVGVDHSSPLKSHMSFLPILQQCLGVRHCLSPAPLTPEQEHPQDPHHPQEAPAAAAPQVISH